MTSPSRELLRVNFFVDLVNCEYDSDVCTVLLVLVGQDRYEKRSLYFEVDPHCPTLRTADDSACVRICLIAMPRYINFDRRLSNAMPNSCLIDLYVNSMWTCGV